MNGGNSNSGGWGSTEMKKIMPEYLNKLTSLDESVQLRDIVKPVIKTYNIGDQKTETATSTDSLWLLAASEIVPKNTDDDRYGWASSNEGVVNVNIKMYKFLKIRMYKSVHFYFQLFPFFSFASINLSFNL